MDWMPILYLILPVLFFVLANLAVSKVMNLNLSRYIPFFLVNLVVSFFLSSPILTLPVFGSIYRLEVPVSRKNLLYHFILYSYLGLHKYEWTGIVITVSISILLNQAFLGTWVSSRMFQLPIRKCFLYYFSVLASTILLSILTSIILRGAYG